MRSGNVDDFEQARWLCRWCMQRAAVTGPYCCRWHRFRAWLAGF